MGWQIIVIYAVIIGAMYFLLIRPQSKRKKEEQKMRDNISVGDEIITIGGFYGKIVAVKDDSYIIESTVDRTKMRILKTAVQTNLTVHEEQQAAKAEKEAQLKAAKEEKAKQKKAAKEKK